EARFALFVGTGPARARSGGSRPRSDVDAEGQIGDRGSSFRNFGEEATGQDAHAHARQCVGLADRVRFAVSADAGRGDGAWPEGALTEGAARPSGNGRARAPGSGG